MPIMQPSSSSSQEDSASSANAHTLSSSLHTLSPASLRELLLSCALENEQVASFIHDRLNSHNGVRTPPYNLENFTFHSSGVSGEHAFGESNAPSSPDLHEGPYFSPLLGSSSSLIKSSSGGSALSKSSDQLLGPEKENRWNWSYYYYKESYSGATSKREADDANLEAASTQSRAYYWNDEFQSISERIRDVDLYAEEHAYISMGNLYADFEHVVETYGRIIIEERFLPYAQKSIPPAFYMGGHAGGEKYIVRGILFKFSVDKDNLYNGDHYAAKAAGHDLKSLIQVYKSGENGLHVPMMCLVDYMGYRLTAMSMLPVDMTTLRYGSCDGGMDVHNDNPELNERMVQLGKALNLKAHAVGSAGKELVGPCDIEGHAGRDGRFYLIDFARLFPPEAPIIASNRKNAHLYRLLRPELVKRNSVPLSSDAFTLFGKRGAGVHNKEVRQATEHLLNELIPRFAKILDFQESPENWPKHPDHYCIKITDARIAEILHREGINLRHLGRLRSKVQSKRWRDSLLLEILTRVIKCVIREKMRAQMEQLQLPGLVLLRQTIVGYLNLVFGNSAESTAYWCTEFTQKIEDMYESALCHERQENCVYFRDKVDLRALFANVRRSTRMVFSPHCLENDNFLSAPYPFQETDLLAFPPKVKQMRIAAYASGTALYLKAKYNTNPTESDRLASMAAVQFEAALKSNPDDDMILCSYALLLRLQKRYDEAKAYYKMAIKSNPRNARIMSHYAWFLYRDRKQYDKAEKYYLKTLEVNPNHARTLSDYGTFLHQVRNNHEKSEEYFLRGVALGDKQAISGYANFLACEGRTDEAGHYRERTKSAVGALILHDGTPHSPAI